MQDAAGAWLLNSPGITLTDVSGLGSFPDTSQNLTTFTFRNGPKVTDVLDKGVRNGEAGIEFRSYTAGTARIVASSGTLAKDSVTITVIHVPDPVLTYTSYLPAFSPTAGPREMTVKSFGNRIALPKSMNGKKIAVSLFDVRGRLLERRPAELARIIARPNAAEGIVIVKVKLVQ